MGRMSRFIGSLLDIVKCYEEITHKNANLVKQYRVAVLTQELRSDPGLLCPLPFHTGKKENNEATIIVFEFRGFILEIKLSKNRFKLSCSTLNHVT